MPKLILQRMPQENGQPTRGSFLWVDDGGTTRHTFIRCLELQWADNAPQVSCIPVGDYKLRWTLSNRFKRYTWQIMDVPGRSGIRVHSGNFAGAGLSDSLGCPLPCLQWADINKDGVIDGVKSKDALSQLEAILKPFEAEGLEISIRQA
jgi:hypothetical protein